MQPLHILLDPFVHNGFMCYGLVAVVILGVTCATLGVYVVLRQMAFIGDAMAHTALPGLVIAYFAGWNLFIGALLADLLTALGIGGLSRRHDIREDTAIGILFTGMFALGIVLISRTHTFVALHEMLLGNLMYVGPADLCLIGAAGAAVLCTLILLHKELELTSFDPAYAQVIGLGAAMLRFVLLILLALTVVSCIKVVGVILTSGLLITPAATASLVTRRLRSMMVIAALVAVAAGIGGLYLSYYFTVSGGAAIVMLCSATFVVVYAFKTLRRRVSLSSNGR